MSKRATFIEFKRKALRKPNVKAEYDALEAAFNMTIDDVKERNREQSQDKILEAIEEAQAS